MLIHDANRTPGKARPQGATPEWVEQLLDELDDLAYAWTGDDDSGQDAGGLQSAIDHLRRSLRGHPRHAGELLLLGYLTWAKAAPVPQDVSEQWDAIRDVLAARRERASCRSRKEMAAGHLPFAQT
jgi:hypothetical protein